jgi:putative ABC transport system permease protein
VFHTAVQDARYALRLLGRSPVFTATAVLSLAIGIGANTTIFSVANALLLRPLPGLARANRLVDIGRTQNGRGFDSTGYPNYRDVRERTTTLSGVYAIRLEPQVMSLASADGAERVYGTTVSGNYFTVLGTEAVRGRLFTDNDDRPESAAATVISYELWQGRFGGDPLIVGKTITITGTPYAVIGVAPKGFQGTTLLRSDLWLPMSAQRGPGAGGADMFTDRRIVWLAMGGRLKDGVTLQQADAELRAIGDVLAREYPEGNANRSFRVAASAMVPGRINFVAAFMSLLMGIVGLVLLIACVNVAGMLLARAAGRRREIAVRLAMGAQRGRLVRQLLTETAVLFAAGCMAALLLTQWLTAVLLSVLPQIPFPLGLEIGLDWHVVTFAVAVSLAAAVLSGLLPALQASRPNLVPSLKTEGLDGEPSRLRLRNAFVVAQITLSLLLVIAAGLFLRALGHAAAIQPGFDQANVDVVSLDFSLAGYNDAQGQRFAGDLVERAAALPGARSAVLAVDLPLDGDRMSFGDVRVPGAPHDSARRDVAPTDWNIVTPGFFQALNVRLLRGRDFNEQDTATSPHVAIVNDAFARQLFGDADPIGRNLEVDTPFGGSAGRLTIVGVAANAHMITLGDEATPYIYVPFSQHYNARMSLIVKTAGATVIPQIRALVHGMNANLPVTTAMPLAEVTAIGLIPQRIAASVAGTLGVVGLLLAAIGIYGVTSYAVSRRTREIGIRMALGADGRMVLALVLRQAIALTAIGVGIGLAAGAAAAQLLRSLLFGVSTVDPLTFTGAALLFTVIALAASYVPARRATRIDAMVALRTD